MSRRGDGLLVAGLHGDSAIARLGVRVASRIRWRSGRGGHRAGRLRGIVIPGGWDGWWSLAASGSLNLAVVDLTNGGVGADTSEDVASEAGDDQNDVTGETHLDLDV